MLRLFSYLLSSKAGHTSSLAAQWHRPSLHRSLYSFSSLGIDRYLAKRSQTKDYFGNNEKKFKLQLEKFVNSSPNRDSMIFTQDIKHLLHLVENNSEDIQLLTKVLRRYSAQDSAIFSDNYMFAPILMRLMCYYKLDEVALTIFNDPDVGIFCHQKSTYQILLDLLFNANRHEDVLSTYASVATRITGNGEKVPKDLATIVFASCYKLNTPESLISARKLFREQRESEQNPTLRSNIFLAALAINQNSPEIALEIICNAGHKHFDAVRNIKALAFARLKRFEEAYSELRCVLESFSATEPNKRHAIFSDVLTAIITEVGRCGLLDTINKFDQLTKLLQEDGHIDIEQTLDTVICSEIVYTPFITEENWTRFKSKRPNAPTMEPTTMKSKRRPTLEQGFS